MAGASFAVVHDGHGTILNRLGVDHKRLTHMFQGRRFRLMDVARVVTEKLLAERLYGLTVQEREML